MQNAHLRLGRLEYRRNSGKTDTNISVHVDRYVGEGDDAHLISLFGGDAEVGAITAAIYEKHTFTVTFLDGSQKVVGFGRDATCYRGSINLPGRKQALRHLIAVSTSLHANGSAGRTFRYAARAKRAQNKIERTESMVLYYLASHDLKKIESHEFTLKRSKNSQDSVVITQPDSIPDGLRRFEAKVDGPLWLEVIDALPKMLAGPLAASVKSSEPSNSAIKQHIANGGLVEGASVKRGYHLRIE
jgi:Siphovirus Gp157